MSKRITFSVQEILSRLHNIADDVSEGEDSEPDSEDLYHPETNSETSSCDESVHDSSGSSDAGLGSPQPSKRTRIQNERDEATNASQSINLESPTSVNANCSQDKGDKSNTG